MRNTLRVTLLTGSVWLASIGLLALQACAEVRATGGLRREHGPPARHARARLGLGLAGREGHGQHRRAVEERDHAGVAASGSLKLDPLEAGGPLTMTVAGKNKLTLGNVLVGEVWLCSGQSNMQMSFAWGVEQRRRGDRAAKFPA